MKSILTRLIKQKIQGIQHPRPRQALGHIRLSANILTLVSLMLLHGPQTFCAPVKVTGAIREAVEVATVPGLLVRRLPGHLNRLYAFDKYPLRDRVPVILVPGRAQEFQHGSWWQKFRDASLRDPDFRDHYKLYLYLYNSGDELQVQSVELVQGIRKVFTPLPPERQLVFVSYSLGGNIVRQAMADPGVAGRTRCVLGLAVPYHGSPVFNPEWFTRYVKRFSPFRIFWDQLFYHTYMSDKVNLIRHLRWDNFDGSLPNFDEESRDSHWQEGLMTYREDAYIREFKKKLTVYAGYLENEFTHAEEDPDSAALPRVLLHKTAQIPRKLLGSILPDYGISSHSALTYTNEQIARLATMTQQFPKGQNIRLYQYNDGVIPLSSMLYLPARKASYDGPLPTLLDAMDIHKARVFKNIDHLDIGEYRADRDRLKVPDLLQPYEGRRTPIEWVLYDLDQMAPEFQAAPVVERQSFSYLSGK